MKNLNIKNPIPKKKLINKGIKIIVKGIKNLKLLSNDNEYDIQYKLDAKYQPKYIHNMYFYFYIKLYIIS